MIRRQFMQSVTDSSDGLDGRVSLTRSPFGSSQARKNLLTRPSVDGHPLPWERENHSHLLRGEKVAEGRDRMRGFFMTFRGPKALR